MRFFRTCLALLTLVGLLVAPISSASAAVNCAVIGPGAGGFAIIGTPSETGTVGVPYNSQFTTDAGAVVTAIGTVPPGLTTSNTGPLFDIILISGTPTTAGSYNLSFDIKVAADAYRCTWTLVIDGGAGGGGGGGGGGFVEPTLTVGDPVKGGEFADGRTITCRSSTFSVTPSRIRIYFTKNGVEIPDDAGTNVTSVDVPSAPGAASLVLTEDLLDSTIGCTVYAKSGATEKTATTSWGVLVAEPKITRVMEVFEDVLRNGGTTIFDNPAVADQVADGFVGGKFTITGRSLSAFTFSLVKSNGKTPTQTPANAEKPVSVVTSTNVKVTLQLPEVTSLGTYYLIARTSTKTLNFPVNINKPILTIANAKSQVSKNRFLLEGDKVYGNTYTTTNDVLPSSTAITAAFKKEFPKGFKVSFIKNSEFLTDTTTANLQKLAKLNLVEVIITGYGFKGGTIKVNNDLATSRATAISKTLINAGLKNVKIIIQIEQFDLKYSRQAVMSIR